MTWQSSEICFVSGHPATAGHFPSNPIIPGALLLDEVVKAVSRPSRNEMLIFRSAKFFRPVRPGDAVCIRWQAQESGGIKFECRLVQGGTLAATGTVDFEPVAQ